jgi:hypothetical protein
MPEERYGLQVGQEILVKAKVAALGPNCMVKFQVGEQWTKKTHVNDTLPLALREGRALLAQELWGQSPAMTFVVCCEDAFKEWFPGEDVASCLQRVRTYMWPQTHNSAALGFPGVGGQEVTTAMTIAVQRTDGKMGMRVYHGGMFAYEVRHPRATFLKRFNKRTLPGKKEFDACREKFEVTPA